MEKSRKLAIGVTYENGRLKLLGDLNPEELAELPICPEDDVAVLPLQRTGCVLQPTREVKCPPGKFFIEVGLDHHDELKVFGIRPAGDLGDRRTTLPGRRSTDRSPKVDA